MSPFCRTCLGLSRPGESRCPLDQEFFVKRVCSECDCELYPREEYCVSCGTRVDDPEETLLLPPAASFGLFWGGFWLDHFAVCVLFYLFLWNQPLWLVLLVGVMASALYRVSGRGGGRQTLGQAVFHTASVSDQGLALSLESALRRTAHEYFLGLPLLMSFDKQSALLEERVDAYEVSLV